MGRLTERTRLMKANFMKHHREGKSIDEIAEIYGLHRTSVYNYLEDIAKENGVSRDSLLQRVFTSYTRRSSYHALEKKEVLDPKELQEDISNVKKVLEQLQEQIATILEED